MHRKKTGETVASFFLAITDNLQTSASSEVIIIDNDPLSPLVEELYRTCHLPLPSSPHLCCKHHRTTAYVAKVINTHPLPVKLLPIDHFSYGYEALLQDRSDKNWHGIWSEDNKGQREPVKAS
jgi:hypothetical protein